MLIFFRVISVIPLSCWKTGVLIYFCFYPAFCDNVHERAGTEEFPFLALPAYARPAGLAGAYTTLAEGIDALGSNPAGLAAPQIIYRASFGLKKNILETHSGEFSYPYHGPEDIWYAASVNYTNFGLIQTRSMDNAAEKEVMPGNHTLTISAARQFFGRVRSGVTFKLPTEYLGGFEGSKWALGWTFDAGIQYQPNVKQFTFAAAVLNAGRQEVAHVDKGETGALLPLEFKGGMVYHFLSIRASAALDICTPYHNHPYSAVGLEYSAARFLTLRAGTRINVPEMNSYFREFALGRDVENVTGKNATRLGA